MAHEDDSVRSKGMAAWLRLKKCESWNDWMETGDLHMVLREEAMREAGTNRPVGKGYNLVMSRKLKECGLDDMDNSTRAKLFWVMENKAEVERYRQEELTLDERLHVNSPVTIWRKYKAYLAKKDGKGKPKGLSPVAKRDEVIRELEDRSITDAQTIADLKAHVAELEVARDSGASRIGILDLDSICERLHELAAGMDHCDRIAIAARLADAVGIETNVGKPKPPKPSKPTRGKASDVQGQLINDLAGKMISQVLSGKKRAKRKGSR